MEKNKLPKASHMGKIDANGSEIECYNLDNGDRVLSRIGFLKALGRTGKAKGGRKYDRESQIPVFLTANNLKPLLTEGLIEDSKPVNFIDLNGQESIGYKAELLPEIAYLFAEAYDKGILKPNQIHIGQQSKVLVRGFLKVSIIALVDEATGYQYLREKLELQTILQSYISKELLAWQKRFPDIFYQEIFRLNKWDFTVQNIKKRPGVVGTWTKKLVYEQLPKGVLEELQNVTPKAENGKLKARLHQSLTPDIGHPDLNSQIFKVVGIMNISDDWSAFTSNFNKMIARKNGQLELNLEVTAIK